MSYQGTIIGRGSRLVPEAFEDALRQTVRDIALREDASIMGMRTIVDKWGEPIEYHKTASVEVDVFDPRFF